MPTMEELLEQALTLEPAQRVEMADALWESVDEAELPHAMSEDELAAEVMQRLQDIQDGKVVPIPWEEAQDRLRLAFPDVDQA